VLAGRRVLLGVSGGIAAYKAALLGRELTGQGVEVTCVLTEAAARFVGPDTFAGLTGRPAYTSLWERPGEVLHVRLSHEADLAVVAPATANVLAKLATGIADDLLTSALLEYAGPLLVAPAMHEGMWTHPATRANVETLRARGAAVLGPAHGALAHGDEGWGRMAEPAEIVEAIESLLDASPPSADLATRHVLVTAGPTHEPIDPVRFLGNRSSGKMGVTVAAEALARGARVTLVLGPGTVVPPPGADVVRVETAEQMRDAVMDAIEHADAVVMTAAVADFRPKGVADDKIKKEHGVPELVLEPTPDILGELSERRRPGQVLVGFGAETGDVVAEGRTKLVRKHVDLLVANLVGRDGTGFGSDTDEAAILSADGDDVAMRAWTKRELASAICDRVSSLLRTVTR
jgi:phosphopantothenoylcysteine decarboxylase / phosphopantothenate---cysteine ligase